MGNVPNICADVCKKDEPQRRTVQSYHHLSLFQKQKAIISVHDMAFPLRTNGARIVDSFDRRIKICAYNLKGFHSVKFCATALEHKTVEDLGKQIRVLGFNTVVIPFSLDFYFENPRVEAGCLGPNEWMKGKKALDVLDITINGLTRAGLLVILRNTSLKAHNSRESTYSDGRWWNDKYPEGKWIDCLRSLTMRYMHNPRVIAIQLRHNITDATWGDGNVLTDWKRAATFAGNEILDINPNINIIIPSITVGDFRMISQSPIQLKLKDKLIFSAKLKPFDFRSGNIAPFRNYLEEYLNCIRKQGHPLLVSADTDQSQQKWAYIIDFLQQTDIDWVYSCHPANRTPESGLFTNDRIAEDLKRIQISTIEASAEATTIEVPDNNRVYSTSFQPAPLPPQAETRVQQNREQIGREPRRV